jgi:2-polyprenyl-3-methyl-5-hydroxy-6-metoxy-1,4-benzoquinol methylase
MGMAPVARMAGLLMSAAADRWARQLADWAIPDAILAQASESPWGFPTSVFARRVVVAQQADTPARRRALEALAGGGSVLDVGAGAGAASLSLVPPATGIVAVDSEPDMLVELVHQAETKAVELQVAVPVQTIVGRWPEVAEQVPPQDVAVCHHVVYNVADIDPFMTALSARARGRVVVVAPERHPLAWMNPLWAQLWGVTRPSGPVVDDLVAVLSELGIEPQVEWFDEEVDPLGEAEERQAQVALVRRRLCLPADRDSEVAAALDAHPRRPWPVAALWWDTPVS